MAWPPPRQRGLGQPCTARADRPARLAPACRTPARSGRAPRPRPEAAGDPIRSPGSAPSRPTSRARSPPADGRPGEGEAGAATHRRPIVVAVPRPGPRAAPARAPSAREAGGRPSASRPRRSRRHRREVGQRARERLAPISAAVRSPRRAGSACRRPSRPRTRRTPGARARRGVIADPAQYARLRAPKPAGRPCPQRPRSPRRARAPPRWSR